MPVRNFRIYGQAYSDAGPVTITLKFNGTTAFTGPVPTTNSTVPLGRVELDAVLASWASDTSVTGTVPVEVTVQNGDVIVGLIEANYSGIGVSVADVNQDHWDITVPPEDSWDDVNLNSADTDGKSNVMLDGVPWPTATRIAGDTGDATFLVLENSTLSFDLFVDPARVVLEAPPFPTVPPNDQPLPPGFNRPLPPDYVPYSGT